VYVSNDSSAIFWFLISLVLMWLIIYTAVRAAVGHFLGRRPLLEAEATTKPDGVRLTITNAGTGPAFDVAVGWQDEPSKEPLARTPMLRIGGSLEVDLAVRAVEGETQIVRFLKLAWREDPDPSPNLFSGRRAVLVPSRLAPRG
jgi:hypothetical protein